MLYMSFLIGLLFICKGGDWFVDASTYIARAFGIPKYIIKYCLNSMAVLY